MMVADALREATARLSATSDTARLDAEVLMAFAAGVSRSDLLIRMMEELAPAVFFRLVGRRAKHEPVAYITGIQEFYGREFTVTPDVLIPRSDSEILIETALEFCRPGLRVLDIGTGSGALLITLLEEYPELAWGHGIDNSAAALDVANRNADFLHCARASFSHFDYKTDRMGLGYCHDTYEIYLCNPPYVETTASLDQQVVGFEPHGALFAGEDGLDDYKVLIPELIRATGTGNGITSILEIGYGQADEVKWLAEKEGFDVELRHDLADRPRALILS